MTQALQIGYAARKLLMTACRPGGASSFKWFADACPTWFSFGQASVSRPPSEYAPYSNVKHSSWACATYIVYTHRPQVLVSDMCMACWNLQVTFLSVCRQMLCVSTKLQEADTSLPVRCSAAFVVRAIVASGHRRHCEAQNRE